MGTVSQGNFLQTRNFSNTGLPWVCEGADTGVSREIYMSLPVVTTLTFKYKLVCQGLLHPGLFSPQAILSQKGSPGSLATGD